MRLSPYIERARADLEAVAGVGGDQAAAVAARLAVALDPSLRFVLLDVVGEAVRELAGQLPQGRVEVRLEAGDPAVVYVEDAPAPASTAGSDALDARITLRLPEFLKSQLERAGAEDGVSVNAWLVQTIAQSLEPKRRRHGTRLTGYARS